MGRTEREGETMQTGGVSCLGGDKRKHERKQRSTCRKDISCDNRGYRLKITGCCGEVLVQGWEILVSIHKTVVDVILACIEVWREKECGKEELNPIKNARDPVMIHACSQSVRDPVTDLLDTGRQQRDIL